MPELDSFLNSTDSLASRENDSTSAYQFDARNERSSVGNVMLRDASIDNAKMGTAVIGTAQIGTLSFNEITGGTARLGGTLNGNGLLQVLQQNGEHYFLANSGSISFYGDSGTVRAEVKFDPTENFLYTRVLQVGANWGGTPSQDGQITLSDSANNEKIIMNIEGLDLRRGANLVFGGTSSPNAGTANTVVLYLDNGGSGTSGSNRLMAKFSAGTPVVVISQP